MEPKSKNFADYFEVLEMPGEDTPWPQVYSCLYPDGSLGKVGYRMPEVQPDDRCVGCIDSCDSCTLGS